MSEMDVVTGVLAGRLVDQSKNPVSGAKVALIDGNGTSTEYVTGQDGVWRFNINVSGSYNVKPEVTTTPAELRFNVTVPGGDFTEG
jgi:hypothetical protein